MRITLVAIAILVSGMSGSLQAAKASRKTHSAHPAQSSSTHKVRKGETAARIARDNGLSLAELEAVNPRINLGRLHAGLILKVHGPSHSVARRDTKPVPSLPSTPALGPTSLTHLEGILPVSVRDLSASNLPGTDSHAVLSEIQRVLPPPASSLEEPAVAVAGFEPADRDHLDLLWPVETRTVSSAWGPRMRSKTVRVRAAKRKVRYRGSHKGVDLTAPKGTDVFAALDGQVIASGTQKGYGNYVILDHGNGVVTLYGHHNRNFVAEGEIVHRGQKIAEVGRTGNATGPHLHFELRLDGAARNPLPYLNDVEEIPADQIAENATTAGPKAR